MTFAGPRSLLSRSGVIAATSVLLAVSLAGCAGMQPQASVDQKRAAEINAELGVNYLRQNDLAQAQLALDRAMQFDPNLALAHLGMASLRERQGSEDSAIEHYRRALEIESGNAYVQTNLGDMLCRRGSILEGQELLSRAIANPSYSAREVALLSSGQCHLRAGETAEAEARIRAALHIDPQYADALYEMAVLTFAQGRPFQTRAFLSRLHALGVATPRSLMLCHESETVLGNAADAQLCAQRLTQEFGDSDEAAELRRRGLTGG